LSFATAHAQKAPKKKKQKEIKVEDANASQRELKLDKHYPVYVTGKAGKTPSPCPIDSLILSLRDSLKKEGFKIMDSVQMHQYNQASIKEMIDYFGKGLSKEEVNARINSRIHHQNLRVQNFSCLSETQEYSIFIYTVPKGGMSQGVSQTFGLPKNSPARIIDIVLGLIRRE
jgi:hypothetical protein